MCSFCADNFDREYRRDRAALEHLIARMGIHEILHVLQEVTCATTVGEMLRIYFAQSKKSDEDRSSSSVR